MTGAPNSQQNSPSLEAHSPASNKTPNRVRTHSAMKANVSRRGRRVNGRPEEHDGGLPPNPFPEWRGPGPPLGVSLPVPWVAAAKVGLEDEAQLKLRGLGEDYGRKRTRAILLSCRMTPPCSTLALPIGAVPPRCRNFVPHATSCSISP